MNQDADVMPRVGSTADVSRRVERLEAKQDELAADVTSLKGTVSRVETNQLHASELNKLRFDALDASIQSSTAKLDQFMTRIEGLISGDVQTNQTREAAAILADYHRWRQSVEERLGEPEKSPLGRTFMSRLQVMESRDKEFDDKLELVVAESARNRQWIAVAGGIIGLLVFIAQFAGPIITKVL